MLPRMFIAFDALCSCRAQLLNYHICFFMNIWSEKMALQSRKKWNNLPLHNHGMKFFR